MHQVVIIDDRVTHRNLLSRLAMAVEEGLRVKTFASPTAALEWLPGAAPDLLVIADVMSGMTAAAFITACRAAAPGAEAAAGGEALPGAGRVPILVQMPRSGRERCHEALQVGATEVIAAPIDHVEFCVRLRNLLALRKLQARRAAGPPAAPPGGAGLVAQDPSDHRLRQLIDAVPALISVVDGEGRLRLINQAYERLYGLRGRGAVGQRLDAVLGEHDAARQAVLDAKVFETGEPLASFEQEVTLAAGDERVLLTSKAPLADPAGQVASVVTVALDVTELRRSEARMRHQADHDAITGLPNRALFRHSLDQALAQARREERQAALLLLDLDRFKGVNDAFGLNCGDLLLKGVAARLRSCLRDHDLIGRLSGDEFVILQADVQGDGEPRALARRLCDSFSQPFQIMGEELHISTSIGVTQFPLDGHVADRLLKNAELAMYRAKSNGRNGTCFFAPQMNLTARRTGLLERELRQAFAADQFTVHYQPQRDLRSGQIVGVEALLRWRHPRRGMVRPTEFISLVEDIGLIAPLTERVLLRACEQHRAWRLAGLPPLRLSVNLSPLQFREDSVVELVAGTLAQTGFDPAQLEIELTEGVMVENSEATINTLHRLRKLGIHFSLDDFGTGYSSLAYVRRLPVQRLKIDQSFVHRLGQEGQDDAIVRTILGLAHSLDLKVTAEGIETSAQLQRLMELNCDEGQGDLISPPLPADAFHVLYAHQQASALAAS